MAAIDNPSDSAQDDHHEHTSGRCARCGHEHHRVERLYQIDDRMLKILALAIAEQMGLEAVRKGRKVTSKIKVAGPDDGSLDRFDARLRDLGAKLDAELMSVAAAFVKAHTGLKVTTAAVR
ncbi:MAG: hypothetical protein WCJ30_17660 [Deltaproteobacteria bacterium]